MKAFPDLIDALPAYQGQFNARELACANSRVLFASYPAGTAIPAHRHETENIGVVTQGTLELIVEGKTSLYQCGDWYHLLPEQEHSAFFVEDTAIIEFWFSPKQ